MSLFYDEMPFCADADSVLNDCRMAVICPLGKFYPNKNYGNTLLKSREVGELLSAARLAADDIDGVFIKNAEIKDNTILFDVMINDELRRLSINIEQNL